MNHSESRILKGYLRCSTFLAADLFDSFVQVVMCKLKERFQVSLKKNSSDIHVHLAVVNFSRINSILTNCSQSVFHLNWYLINRMKWEDRNSKFDILWPRSTSLVGVLVVASAFDFDSSVTFCPINDSESRSLRSSEIASWLFDSSRFFK